MGIRHPLLCISIAVCALLPLKAVADTVPALFASFAGNMNFIGTQRTLRTQSDAGDSCAVTAAGTTTTATLAGLPSGATITAAYLYWAGSGATPDYNVTFEGNTISADPARSYTATFNNAGTDFDYFSGVADVTGDVTAKGNGTYSFSGLTVSNGAPWCGSSAVLAGWALLVIYEQAAEDFRVINVYEGFQHFRGSNITLTPSNFLIPSSPINGKDAHLTWEGDVGNSASLGGFNEQLTFNGTVLSDANNPVNNQFNSVSTMSLDTNSYGVDFDVYAIDAYLTAGDTSATTVYSSGGDLVLLSAQIISTTNDPTTDLEISMTRNGDLVPGQNGTYTLTVTNNGPLSEPGPITVVDTLPAGLSYVSATGTGWSCGAAGQTVTCTRSGSLANGAVAASITLTVAVSGGASGTVVNTATVSGQNFDNIAGNNTATDSYLIIQAAYAYYAMDETTWGTITDSSGNGRNAAALGSAAPTDYPPPNPPNSALTGDPGTCGAGEIPVTNGTQAVDTAIDINDIGNSGTIAFWYSSNTDWDQNADRMLFDASNNLGNGGADKHFYLVKDDNGSLLFAFENSGDTDYEAQDPTNRTFAAGTWHHIAVTWNMGNPARLYLDGVEVDNSGNTAGSMGNMNTLYLGDQRTGGMAGTAGDYTTNSANGYIDEVRIFQGELSAAVIAQLMTLRHSCGTFHHLELRHGSGASLTCNPDTLTLVACADIACSSFYTGGLTGTLTATGTPTVNWTGGAAFSIPAGSSSITKGFQVTTPGSTVFGVSGVTPAPSNAATCNFGTPSCTFTAADTGFIFDVPNHIADVTQNVTISAVRTDDTTQRCVPAFQSTTKTLNFWSTYLNPNTGTQAAAVNGTNITGASPGTAFNLNFDANGQVAVTVRYPDVGQVQLNVRHTGSGDAAGLIMNGQDIFITRPQRFVLTIAGNPAAADENGGAFTRAGADFTINVEARNAGDAITPNYGRESSPETVSLTKTLVLPAGGNNPNLTGSFGDFGEDCSGNPATAGAACGTFTWPEVGIITLEPAVGDGDYLGTGNVTGTASGNIGRFIPDHFTLTNGTLTPRIAAGCAPASTFTYMDENLELGFRLTVHTVGGSTTQNYTGVFAKLDPTDQLDLNFGAINTAEPTALTARISTGVITAGGGWNNGVVDIIAPVFIERAAAPDGPYQQLAFGAAPEDTDLVALDPATRNLDTDNDAINESRRINAADADIRYGRLFMENAFGSELMPLALPFYAEYYTGTQFVLNADDSCTAYSSAGITFANRNGLTADPTPGGASSLIGGRYDPNNPIILSAPGAGNTGSIDAILNVLPYLHYDWTTDGNLDGTEDDDPFSKATFGIYGGPEDNQIYIREVY